MTKSHLKRLKAEKSWKIKRKKDKFITRPKPGAHSFAEGIPLGVILKELLEYAKTTKEIKHILYNKEVLVDGKIRKDHRYLAGFMDMISVPKKKEHFRILFNNKGHLYLKQVKDNETKFKLCKISGKRILIKKKMQISFHDGRTMLVDKDSFKVGDTLIIELPKQKIKEHLKLEPKAQIYLFSGRHVGGSGTLENIRGKYITFKNKKGDVFETLKKYVFVIGKNKPVVEID